MVRSVQRASGYWVRDDNKHMDDEELYGIDDNDVFDTEEFDDYESYREKFSDDDENSPGWFGKGESGKKYFDKYRRHTGRPFKIKTRRHRD